MKRSQLREVFSSNPTAKVILRGLSERDRDVRGPKFEQDLMRFRHDLSSPVMQGRRVVRPALHFDRTEFLKTFQAIEALGLGTLVVGRRGQADRFKWGYSIRSVVAFVRGKGALKQHEHQNRYHLPQVEPDTEATSAPVTLPARRSGTVTMTLLVDGKTVTIELPPDQVGLVAKSLVAAGA